MVEHSPEDAPPARRGSGCLKGCLWALLVAVLVFGAGTGLIAWHLYSEFRGDPRLQAVVLAVKSDARGRGELGRHFAVMEVDRRFYPFGKTRAEEFRLVIIGRHGQRIVTATLEPVPGGMRIATLTIDAPDGHSVALRAPTH
jgi:hypothetical protein